MASAQLCQSENARGLGAWNRVNAAREMTISPHSRQFSSAISTGSWLAGKQTTI